MAWTVEDENYVREKWGMGWSASEIALGLNNGVSRSAVCGKVDRLNLPTRNKLPRQRHIRGKPFCRRQPTPSRPPRAQPKARPTKAQERRDAAERRSAAHRLRDDLPNMMATELTDLPPEDASRAVSFFDVKNDQCRWPIGDPIDLAIFRFCGAPADNERPYCGQHCRMAYQPKREAA